MRLPAPRTLRLAAVLCAATAALAAWRGGEAPVVRVLALDVSRSVADDQSGLAEVIAEWDRWEGERGSSAALVFADGATVSSPPGARERVIVLGGVAEGETDIEAGLRAALGLVPEGARGEIVIATDGRATKGDAAAALAEARRRGVAVRAIPLGRSGLPLRAAAVEAPPVVRVEERFPVSVLVTGSPGAKGEVVLEDAGAGQSETRAVTIPEGGRARIVFARSAAAPGVRRYRAGDAEAAVLVEDGASVLRLGREPAAPGTADLLRRLGGGSFEDAAGPAAVASALRAQGPLAARALLVLDDLPERLLPPGAGEEIRREVEAGLGLVVLGGPETLGPGGFAGRPLEEALPVRCAPDRPRPLVVLAVDVSGSMEGAATGGPSPAHAARVAAAELAARLPSDARLCLVFFHDGLAEATDPLDLGTPAGRDAAAAAAAKVRPAGGGTRFGAAVEGALGAAAKAPGSGARLLLVVTDGRPADAPDELRRLGVSLKETRFAVRVVPVAGEPDAARLDAFVAAAGGTVVAPGMGAAGLADTLASLAAAEDRGLWSPGAEAVRAGPDAPPFGAVPAGLPPVAGHDRVVPRKDAETWLALAGGDALLVAGRRGLGRSVVFAAPPAGGSAEWTAAPAASLLEAAARWAMRAAGSGGVEASALRRPDGSVLARLETLPDAAPAGEVRADGEALRRTGAARWEGIVPAPASGDREVVVFESGGVVLARAAVGPAPSAEDAALGPDEEALALLASPAGPPARGGGAGPAAVAAALLSVLLLLAAAGSDARTGRGSSPV